MTQSDSIDEVIDEYLGAEIVGISIDPEEEVIIFELEDGRGILIGGKETYIQLLDREQVLLN
jgi:hypothetical protein